KKHAQFSTRHEIVQISPQRGTKCWRVFLLCLFVATIAAMQPRIVVLGGGFGGLFTALYLAGSGEITLVSDEDHFLFTPMLYEYLSGEVAPDAERRAEGLRLFL